jgi:hypothetical protein
MYFHYFTFLPPFLMGSLFCFHTCAWNSLIVIFPSTSPFIGSHLQTSSLCPFSHACHSFKMIWDVKETHHHVNNNPHWLAGLLASLLLLCIFGNFNSKHMWKVEGPLLLPMLTLGMGRGLQHNNP